MSDAPYLVVADGPRPGSRLSDENIRSHDGEGNAVLADSRVRKRLTAALSQYAKGERRGGAYLVAGHRGSGKTTTALDAIGRANVPRSETRPLVVWLYAPPMLELERSARGKAWADAEALMSGVAVGLFHALGDELVRCLARRGGEAVELAAQLRAELAAAPSLARLRELWRRSGVLDEGVLFPDEPPQPEGEHEENDIKATALDELVEWLKAPRPVPLDREREPGQNRGVKEASALWHAGQAFQVATGELASKQVSQDEAGRRAELKWESVTSGKRVLNPLLGLLSGALVGVSLYDVGGFAAALAGTLVGLGTTTTLNLTAERLVNQGARRETTFVPDYSTRSLARMLPRLVEHVREIGLAPVFVIDELDKVDGLSRRMGRLIDNLKHFVTENAFFIFLADRAYFEQEQRSLGRSPYGREYTFFTERLFLAHDPRELHAFLGELLKVPEKHGLDDDQLDTLRTDLVVLRYVLLLRARLHPYDLRRLLSARTDEEGHLALPPGGVRSDAGSVGEALMQVAIEWLLDQPALRERLARRPHQTQIVYDALYLPARRWRRGQQMKVTVDELRGYLVERIGAEERRPSDALEVREELVKLLHEQIELLCGYLDDPGALVEDIRVTDATRFHDVVLDTIAASDPLLTGDGFWRVVFTGPSADAPEQALLTDALATISAVQETLAHLTPGVDLAHLSRSPRFLPPSPDWQAIRRFRDRLAAELDYPERAEQADQVVRFASMLRDKLPDLYDALLSARLMVHFWDASPPELAEPMRRLTEGMARTSTHPGQGLEGRAAFMRTMLEQLLEQFPARTALEPIAREPWPRDGGPLAWVDAWADRLERSLDVVAAAPSIEPAARGVVTARAWTLLELWFSGMVGGIAPAAVLDVDGAFLLMQALDPLLDKALAEAWNPTLDVRTWSELGIEALDRRPENGRFLAALAFNQLGLDAWAQLLMYSQPTRRGQKVKPLPAVMVVADPDNEVGRDWDLPDEGERGLVVRLDDLDTLHRAFVDIGWTAFTVADTRTPRGEALPEWLTGRARVHRMSVAEVVACADLAELAVRMRAKKPPRKKG